MTINDLKKLGYKVKVRHLRRYKCTFPKVKDLYITKGQMKFDSAGVIHDLISKIRASTKFNLVNNGGRTEISILDDKDNLLGFGWSNVHPKDNFNKKIAIINAFGRALHDAESSGVNVHELIRTTENLKKEN